MTANELRFDVTGDVLGLGLRGAYLVMSGLTNRPEDPELERMKAETTEELLAGLTAERIDANPVLQGFRRLHDTAQRSNRKNVASPENLLHLLLKNRQLPRINVLVDAYNLVSVHTQLALGAHDVAKVNGHIHLRMTDGTEGFWPLGSPEAKPMTAGEYSYVDDGNDVICRLEVRQVEKTKVTPDTTEAFYIIQGNDRTSDEDIRAAVEQLLSLTKRFCGGQERMLYCPWQQAG